MSDANPEHGGRCRTVALSDSQARELAVLRIERDDAVAALRVIGDELVLAGYSGGDRTVRLASLRALIADAKRYRTALLSSSTAWSREMIRIVCKCVSLGPEGQTLSSEYKSFDVHAPLMSKWLSEGGTYQTRAVAGWEPDPDRGAASFLAPEPPK